MLVTISVVLLIVWLFGIAGVYTIGPSVHLLGAAAAVLFLIGMSGKRQPIA